MKVRLLKRLRREADRNVYYPYRFFGFLLENFDLSVFRKTYGYYLALRQKYILRRVAELKAKRK